MLRKTLGSAALSRRRDDEKGRGERWVEASRKAYVTPPVPWPPPDDYSYAPYPYGPPPDQTTAVGGNAAGLKARPEAAPTSVGRRRRAVVSA